MEKVDEILTQLAILNEKYDAQKQLNDYLLKRTNLHDRLIFIAYGGIIIIGFLITLIYKK